MSDRKSHILFAGGGTGGHLFPGIAIAEEIQRTNPSTGITFVGTKKKIEAQVVPACGYRFETIWISGLRRRLSAENLLFPLKLVVALVQSFSLLKKLRPDVVVGTGGYVCGPVVYVASLMGIPTLIQEQNSFPGVTTRMLAARATEVHLTFEASTKYLRRQDNVKISGTPTRSSLGKATRGEAARFFELDPGRKTLLAFGGSQGATSINEAVLNAHKSLVENGVQIIWQTGEADFERVQGRVQDGPNIKILGFIERMDFAYAACDMAVCRAGATTLAELTLAGVPSVLVPYPFAAADHQTENARTMVEAGAAMMVLDHEVDGTLLNTVMTLLNDARRLSAMAEKTRSLGRPDAAATLARAVVALARA